MRVAAVVAALLAATILPGAAPGLGVLLVAVVIALAAGLGAGPSVDLWVFGSAAVGLAASAAIVDAGWLVATDLVAAGLLATIAVAGPRLVAPVTPVVALRGVPAITPRPGADAVLVLRGAAFVGIVVLPFGALLLTGDAAFAAVAGAIPLPGAMSIPLRAAVFALVLAGSIGLGLGGQQPLRRPALRPVRALTPIEWILPLAALVALFVAFVAVQATVLFRGHDYVLRTTGLTYAAYARSGYWHLLAAAVLSLAVIGPRFCWRTLRCHGTV